MAQPTTTSPQTRYAEAYRTLVAQRQPAWLRDRREEAMARFEAAGFPTARRGNEPWKYTDVSAIADAAFVLDGAPALPTRVVALKPFALPCARVHEIVFLDGHYAFQLSTVTGHADPLPADPFERHASGLIVGRISEAVERGLPLVEAHLARHANIHDSAFTALNTAFTQDGAFVYIPDGAVVAEPIYVLCIASSGAVARVAHPRILIIAGGHSKASVVVAHETLGTGASFANAVTEVVAGEGAQLGLWRLQRESPAAYHVATTQVEVAQDAQVTMLSAELGGALVRHDVRVRLAAAGASCVLNGVAVESGTQHMDTHTYVDHAVAHTASDELFKSILAGTSRGVFMGSVLVRPDAQQTIARQVSKSLLLSAVARMDAQPKLEIFADDVQCTHGAAVGSLDDAALFYLRSRGLSAAQARALLTHGFLNDVIARVTDEAVRQHLDTAIGAALANVAEPVADSAGPDGRTGEADSRHDP